MMNKQTPTERAVDACGGVRGCADICGVHESTVRRWISAGCVPTEYVSFIQDATGLDRELIRPDVWPPGGATGHHLRRLAESEERIGAVDNAIVLRSAARLVETLGGQS